MSERRDIHPREDLSAFLDGELPDPRRVEVAAHLSACASCRGMLEDFRIVAAAVSREPVPAVPGDLRGRIRRSVEARPPAYGGTPRWMATHRLGLAAAAGVVVVAGLWALRREPASFPPGAAGSGRIDDRVASDSPDAAPKTGIVSSPAPVPESRQTADRLKSLGYAEPPPPVPRPGSAARAEEWRHEKDEAAEDARTPLELNHESAPPGADSGDSAPGAPSAVPVVPRSAAREGARMTRAQAENSGAALKGYMAGRPARRLALKDPAYLVNILEDGTVTLTAGGYACSARREGSAVDPDIAALFTLADSAPAPGAGDAGVTRPVEPPVRYWHDSAAAGEEATQSVPLPASRAAEIERRIKALLRRTYLPILEDRCGSPPVVVRSF